MPQGDQCLWELHLGPQGTPLTHPVTLPGAASTAPVPTLPAPGRTEDSETSEGALEHPSVASVRSDTSPTPFWVTRQCLGLAVLSRPSPLLLTGCQHHGWGSVSPATLLGQDKAYLSQGWPPATRTRSQTLLLCFLCWHLS